MVFTTGDFIGKNGYSIYYYLGGRREAGGGDTALDKVIIGRGDDSPYLI